MGDTDSIYPLTDTGRGNVRQGLYASWGCIDNAALIGAYLFQSVFNDCSLSNPARLLFTCLISLRGQKGKASDPIELSVSYAMSLIASRDKKSVSNAIKDLIKEGLLIEISKPHPRNVRVVKLNVEHIHEIEEAWIKRNVMV